MTRCTLLRGILRRSFQETSPRNTAENTAKHRGGGVVSMVTNHRGGGESSVTVTTLFTTILTPQLRQRCVTVNCEMHVLSGSAAVNVAFSCHVIHRSQ